MKIEIIRGDDVTLNFTIDDNGDPLNITGYTAFLTVKKKVDNDAADAAAIIKKMWSLHTDPTIGTTEIKLTKTDTDKTPGIYLFDLQLKNGAGDIITARYGEFVIYADITRRTS